MKRYICITAILIIGIFLSAGCKESPDLQPELTGVWTKAIESGGKSAEGVLTFTAEATFEFTVRGEAPGHEDTKGRYSQTGHEITFEGSSCVDPGTYRFDVTNNVLTFTPLRDDCTERKETLTGTWNKSGE